MCVARPLSHTAQRCVNTPHTAQRCANTSRRSVATIFAVSSSRAPSCSLRAKRKHNGTLKYHHHHISHLTVKLVAYTSACLYVLTSLGSACAFFRARVFHAMLRECGFQVLCFVYVCSVLCFVNVCSMLCSVNVCSMLCFVHVCSILLYVSFHPHVQCSRCNLHGVQPEDHPLVGLPFPFRVLWPRDRRGPRLRLRLRRLGRELPQVADPFVGGLGGAVRCVRQSVRNNKQHNSSQTNSEQSTTPVYE